MATPARNLENALCTDLLTAAIIPELDGLSVYPGLNAETKKLPRLQVVVDDVGPAPGFEGLPGCREHAADLYLVFVAQAEDVNEIRDRFCEEIEAVQQIMEEPEQTTLKSFLNKPADPDPDERTVKELHIYQADYVSARPDPLEQGNWQFLLHYRVQFGAFAS